MNELSPFDDQRTLPAGTNAGSVAIEQERAIAEARGQIQLAKMFPRDHAAAFAELMEACKSPEFAETAFYSVPNRGSGPSIRFAEEIARCYGNFEYGHRELSRDNSKSEVEVYAWDKEKNNYSKRQITVDHVRYTRQGNKPLLDPTDIDNRIANVASKQMRGRILALVSKSLVAAGLAECQRTISGNGQMTIAQRVQQMLVAFQPFGVNAKHLEGYIGGSLDNATADDLTDLLGVFNALKEGAKIADYFETPDSKPELPDETTPSALGKQAATAQKPKKKAPAKKKTEPEPEPVVDQSEPETDDDDDDLDSLFD